MVKKLLILGVALIMAFSLWACETKIPYNAVMFGSVYENRTWLKDEFYEDNLTYGAWSSLMKTYKDGEDEPLLGGYIKDAAYPKYRTKIIASKKEFAAIFKAFPQEVDFDQKMVLIHCFTTASSSSYEISSIVFEEQKVIVNYKTPKKKGITPPNASMPLTKWVIVVMDKLNIETAEFIFGNINEK